MELTLEMIKSIKNSKADENKKFDMLDSYYKGFHTEIEKRKKDPDLKNNKITVNHCKKIVDTNAGFLLGEPVQYQVDENVDISSLLEEYNKQTIKRLDVDIVKKVGRFGKGYEYIYAKPNKKNADEIDVASVFVDPRNAYIKRANTVEQEYVYGVFWTGEDEDTKTEIIIVTDAIETSTYELKDGVLSKDKDRSGPHLFGRVPMIEYLNNDEQQGDFEQIIKINDAVNMLQSDRINDKEQLVSAILAIYGATVDENDADEIKKSRIAMFPDGSKAEYLIKTMVEGDIEILKKSLVDDIYSISMTPNLNDEQFAGNASGVALELKLLPFVFNIANKEVYISKGLDERFEIYSNILSSLNKMEHLDASDMDVVFKYNMPQNKLEVAQIISLLWGKVDRSTLISWLPDVEDAQNIIDALEADEASARSKYGISNYGEFGVGVDEDNKEL